jgi:hypothetical protein
MHRKWSVLEYFRRWWQAGQRPLCISEFGTPETFDPVTRVDDFNRFVTAGVDRHRVAQARMLRETLDQAHREGIPIPYGGWYPGTGNIGWGFSLTRERKTADCDRAGIVDLCRQQDGTLKRILLKEVMALRHAGAASPVQVLDAVPAPVLEPIAPAATAGSQPVAIAAPAMGD